MRTIGSHISTFHPKKTSKSGKRTPIFCLLMQPTR
ncbi:hypothetical protein GcM3_059041 [Golovinomyces cichoracearum]|uniref:Uncharacterized protein n=1 Tax=Golovinomyces cichoracearum TaxID=62708 RepID=A0A420IWV9_9PEZI|nr:hypothetical protein GcM3_059041 [Golovinomyces cichoracearum]